MKIIHQLPGRLRLEIPQIFRNPSYGTTLKATLIQIRGIKEVQTNFFSARVLITYYSDLITSLEILKHIEKALHIIKNESITINGHKKVHDSKTSKRINQFASTSESYEKRNQEVYELESLPIARQAFFTCASGAILLYSSVTHNSNKKAGIVKPINNINSALTLISGYPLLRTALEHLLKQKHMSTELLSSVASVTSLIVAESRFGLMINTIVYLSTLLRTLAAEYARDKIRVLLEGNQTTASIKTPHGLLTIPSEHVKPGEIVMIKTGERIPVDGIVSRGNALIEQHLIRGNAAPFKVNTGDKVYAGSKVSHGALLVKAKKTGTETYIGRIIQILPRCSSRSPLIDHKAAELSRKISTTAILAATGIFLITRDAKRAITVLVVGAPGAAGLASSMAFGTAAGHAAAHGILVKDDRHVEKMGEADTVLFDQLSFLPSNKGKDIETIEMVKEGNVACIGLLTDQPEHLAAAAAKHLKLDKYWSECKPREKLAIIRRLQKRGHKIALIGDEKDVVALSSADVSITTAQGDELNLESANIVIIGQDPRQVPWLKLLANSGTQIARQNTALSLTVHILGLGLGIINKLSPLTMTILQNASTIGILVNSSRLLLPVKSRISKQNHLAETAATLEYPVYSHRKLLANSHLNQEPVASRHCEQKKSMDQYSVLPVVEVIKRLKSNPESGLSKRQANLRLSHYGANILPSHPLPTIPEIFVKTLTENYMSKVLLGLGGISILLGKHVNAVMSVGVLFANTLMAVVQEKRTQKSLHLLDGLVPQKAQVLRSGKLEIVPAKDLVPGDIILIEAGDKVPADARLLCSNQLVVEEASLTGESVPVIKVNNTPDQASNIFMGTGVLAGSGQAIITKTGQQTEIGRISQSIDTIKSQRSPFYNRIDELFVSLVHGGIAVSGLSVLAGLIYKQNLGDIIENATSLAVSFIPDGLAPIITLSTALGGLRLMKQHVAVRELPAIDTLGCTSVICCDKTGTMTKNQMEVQEIFYCGQTLTNSDRGFVPVLELNELCKEPEKSETPSIEHLFCIACICNNAKIKNGKTEGELAAEGDSTETALLMGGIKAGIDIKQLIENFRRKNEIPFSSETMFMAVTGQNQDGKEWSYIKGAPDIVLNRCSFIERKPHLIEPITKVDQEQILNKLHKMSDRALRVLAFAYKPSEDGNINLKPDEELIFSGLIGILDPPRAEAKVFAEDCHNAGVKVFMITGDHKNTALAVAKKIGIVHGNAKVLTGNDLNNMTDEELKQAVKSIQIYARTSPRHKQILIKALKSQEEVVCMVGDGINDVPAIKEAHLGVSMGITGTAVAREASAITLTNDNISGLSAAIKEGRNVYTNIRNTMRYMITTNFADGMVILIASLFGNPLPLTPLQLLWVNITGDPVISWSLANYPSSRKTLKSAPRKTNESIFGQGLGRKIVSRSALIGLSAFMVYYLSIKKGDSLKLTRSKTMTVLSLGRIIHLIDYRRKKFDSQREHPNRGLTSGGILMFTAILGANYLPLLRTTLQTSPLAPADWLPVIGWAGLTYLIDTGFNRHADSKSYRHASNTNHTIPAFYGYETPKAKLPR